MNRPHKIAFVSLMLSFPIPYHAQAAAPSFGIIADYDFADAKTTSSEQLGLFRWDTMIEYAVIEYAGVGVQAARTPGVLFDSTFIDFLDSTGCLSDDYYARLSSHYDLLRAMDENEPPALRKKIAYFYLYQRFEDHLLKKGRKPESIVPASTYGKGSLIHTKKAGVICKTHANQNDKYHFTLEANAAFRVKSKKEFKLVGGGLLGFFDRKWKIESNPVIKVLDRSTIRMARRTGYFYVFTVDGAAIVKDKSKNYFLGPNMVYAKGLGANSHASPQVALIEKCPNLNATTHQRIKSKKKYTEEIQRMNRLNRSARFGMINMDSGSRDSHKPAIMPMGTLSFGISLP
jgi:hypothetical protein